MDGDKFFQAHGMLLVIQRFSSGVMEQIDASHWKWQHNLWSRGSGSPELAAKSVLGAWDAPPWALERGWG